MKKLFHKIKRFYHKLYAFLGSYFWLPCPICKEYFGGHEVYGYLLNSPYNGRGWGICPKCTDEAEIRNRNIRVYE